MAEAAVEQDDGCAGAIGGVPDACSLVFDVAVVVAVVREWRQCDALGFELVQVVVMDLILNLALDLAMDL
ncbi:hypothetical protein RBB75_07155 [Tunturibacter empetritectus]|uniref:Uncharacterized protein n=1 Tax=Tunturiibacter empetritectus TaxID=3069691 RepID=A0AAU7ZH73_9BACT